MKITFLGTQAMQPTRERGLPAIHLSWENENCLIDCGEGTQRQMKIAGVKPTKLTRVFISHFHADHMLGLAGLIRNLGANEYKGTLELYGPKGLPAYFEHLMKSSAYTERVQTKLIEIKQGTILDTEKFTVEAHKLFHSIESFAFVIKEKPKRKINLSYTKRLGLIQHPLLGELQKGRDIEWKGKKVKADKATILVPGKKYVFIQDTRYHDSLAKFSENADLLVSESTFQDSEKEKAKEYKHMTASQAATIGKKAKVKKLILTHFSQRYEDLSEMKKEAKKIFPSVILAEDFMSVEV